MSFWEQGKEEDERKGKENQTKEILKPLFRLLKNKWICSIHLEIEVVLRLFSSSSFLIFSQCCFFLFGQRSSQFMKEGGINQKFFIHVHASHRRRKKIRFGMFRAESNITHEDER